MSSSYPYPWKPAFPWVTWLIVGTTAAMFIAQVVTAYLLQQDALGGLLSCNWEALARHRYGTLLLYAWAHAVPLGGESQLLWLHIAANMIPLICLGPALEDLLGPWRYLGLYLGGTLAAAVTWLCFDSDPDPTQRIIGASGAIFALIAAAGTAAPRAQVTVYILFVLPIRMNLRSLALGFCGIELLQLVFNWMPDVAHSAHLGGAAFGFVYVLTMRAWSESLQPVD